MYSPFLNTLDYIASLIRKSELPASRKHRRIAGAYLRIAEESDISGKVFKMAELERMGLCRQHLDDCYDKDVWAHKQRLLQGIHSPQAEVDIFCVQKEEVEFLNSLSKHIHETGDKSEAEEWFGMCGDMTLPYTYSFRELGISESDTFKKIIAKISSKIVELSKDNIITGNHYIHVPHILTLTLSPQGNPIAAEEYIAEMELKSGQLSLKLQKRPMTQTEFRSRFFHEADNI